MSGIGGHVSRGQRRYVEDRRLDAEFSRLWQLSREIGEAKDRSEGRVWDNYRAHADFIAAQLTESLGMPGLTFAFDSPPDSTSVTYEHRYIPVVEYDEEGREIWTPPLPVWTLTKDGPE